jgi:hypothetical protein
MITSQSSLSEAHRRELSLIGFNTNASKSIARRPLKRTNRSTKNLRRN